MKRFFAIGILVAVLMSLIGIAAVAQGVKNVELHGYMLNRFYMGPDNPTKFVTERVSLSATGQIGETMTGYVEVYFHPWITDDVLGGGTFTAEQYRTYLESAYVDMPLGGGRVRLGKGRQLNFGMTPTYPNRKTTQYGIVSETFTQDRIVGAQYSYKKGAFDLGTSVYTDYRLGTRDIGGYAGATNIVKHWVNKDDPANSSNDLAVSAKAGITLGSFRAHISGATGKLLQADADKIGAAYGVATTDRAHNMYGADAAWGTGPFIIQGQWYQGAFSFLKTTGYSATIGYEPKNNRRVYLRYDALSNDQAPVLAQPTTWDTQQLTFGLVQPIAKGVWAELNYEKNMESTGSIDNDLLFVEFFTGF